MKSGNIENVKSEIQRIGLGLLKTSGSHALSIPTTCLIEVFRFTEDNVLWCLTSDMSSSEITKTHTSTVKLKFVRKDKGLFIKLIGRAEVVETHEADGHAGKETFSHQHRPVMLKIQIEHADCFQKRSTSRYTSFLQSISHFAMGKALANRGV